LVPECKTPASDIEDAPTETVIGDAIVARRRWSLVTMADLLARFDPAKHQHELAFHGEPVGSETP
jgi:hypothetical protein